jgi:hypothetical protein
MMIRRGKLNKLGENLYQSHIVHHKSHRATGFDPER